MYKTYDSNAIDKLEATNAALVEALEVLVAKPERFCGGEIAQARAALKLAKGE